MLIGMEDFQKGYIRQKKCTLSGLSYNHLVNDICCIYIMTFRVNV